MALFPATRMRRGVGSKDRKTTRATTSTTPVHQLQGSATAETTPAGTQAAAAEAQHAKGRTGDCPGPRQEAATRWTVTQGGGGCFSGGL